MKIILDVLSLFDGFCILLHISQFSVFDEYF